MGAGSFDWHVNFYFFRIRNLSFIYILTPLLNDQDILYRTKAQNIFSFTDKHIFFPKTFPRPSHSPLPSHNGFGQLIFLHIIGRCYFIRKFDSEYVHICCPAFHICCIFCKSLCRKARWDCTLSWIIPLSL